MAHYKHANYFDGPPDYCGRQIHLRIHSASDFLEYGNGPVKHAMLTGYNLNCGIGVSG